MHCREQPERKDCSQDKARADLDPQSMPPPELEPGTLACGRRRSTIKLWCSHPSSGCCTFPSDFRLENSHFPLIHTCWQDAALTATHAFHIQTSKCEAPVDTNSGMNLLSYFCIAVSAIRNHNCIAVFDFD